MFTSAKPAGERKNASAARGYLAAAGACALFGAIYELFSHGVWSAFMIGAFAFPLLLGALPFALLQKVGKPYPGKAAAELIHAGVAALTVGSIIRGVLAIYGTDNPLAAVYWIVGTALTAVGWLAAAVRKRSC